MMLRPAGHLSTFSGQRYNAGILDVNKREAYISGRAFDWLELPSGEGQPLERLQLQAIKVGHVEQTQYVLEHSPEGFFHEDPHSNFKILKAMVQFCRQMPKRYWHDTMPGEELFRTLFIGSPTGTRLAFHHWATRACVSHFLNVGIKAERAKVEQEFRSFHSIAGSPTELAAILGTDIISEYRALLRAFATDRPNAARKWIQLNQRPSSDVTNSFDNTLFTLTGDRIGITARSCQVGDEIWVLQGANWPYILRPTKWAGNYQLVGQAYVDGVMQGEFVLNRGEDPGWQPVWIL